ncbi:hypothetical protein, variant [Aphanomyces astaci]|uniref:RRM domain-containing protein n=1 Tax=Aphanomyces astaci TaxID=112090 RepID=W4GE35_APHAT|nr:hypothetical protein, variant [Aphanomyces astaci]ETV77526.1 hypothetical protein, variant [Aphanomyces astaci]|eukprot:XP_009832636.1 hypothetical protein, variant [Aphanomyces astaci]
MAGRGRELTLPAWMRQQQQQEAPVPPPPSVHMHRHDPNIYADASADLPKPSRSSRDDGYGGSTSTRPREEPRRDEYASSSRQDNSRREDISSSSRRDEVPHSSRSRDDAQPPPPSSSSRSSRDDVPRSSHRSSHHESRSDKPRESDRRGSDRGSASDRGSDRRRRDRSRSKGSSSRDPRRDYDEPRSSRSSRGDRKGDFKKMEGFGTLSLSGSGRVRVRRFDILPAGVTQDTAATYAAEVIMQAKLAALSGIVGPASFGPPTNAHMHHLSFGGSQHSRHARRLYVGGFGEITEAEIERFFNEVIDKALGEVQEHGSVVSVYINRERHFAFVELKTIELTTACMELDGITYHGQPLKIRRPNDYNPSAVKETGPIPKLDVNALGIVSTSVSDGPGKIFVGGLPYQLNEEQVKELLQAFGALKSFHLVKELNTNLSKGYGFCEYLDPAITQIACAGLNDMQVGDKILTVRTAQTAGGLFPPQFDPLTGTEPLAVVPSAPLGQPSRVLVLLNMVTPADLSDPEEFQDICDDIRAECEKSGAVQDMVVPRPGEAQYHPSSVCKVGNSIGLFCAYFGFFFRVF